MTESGGTCTWGGLLLVGETKGKLLFVKTLLHLCVISTSLAAPHRHNQLTQFLGRLGLFFSNSKQSSGRCTTSILQFLQYFLGFHSPPPLPALPPCCPWVLRTSLALVNVDTAWATSALALVSLATDSTNSATTFWLVVAAVSRASKYSSRAPSGRPVVAMTKPTHMWLWT